MSLTIIIPNVCLQVKYATLENSILLLDINFFKNFVAVSLGEECNKNKICMTENSVCIDGKCQCNEQSFQDHLNCLKSKLLNIFLSV